MFKFLVKVVVVVLAIQAGMSFLRKEGIISGEIKINYAVVKEKVLKIIPTEKISEKLLDIVNSKIRDGLTSKVNAAENNFSHQLNHQNTASAKTQVIVHVVSQGETLSELSLRYGVHRKVIKKMNDLDDDGGLNVGQKIRIPAKEKNLT